MKMKRENFFSAERDYDKSFLQDVIILTAKGDIKNYS